MAGRNSDEIRCSFCNKTQDQVRKMIAGPSGVYICDHCVEICADIVEEEFEDDAEAFAEEEPEMEINLLKPAEIKDFLDDYVIGQEEAKKVLVDNGVPLGKVDDEEVRLAYTGTTDEETIVMAEEFRNDCLGNMKLYTDRFMRDEESGRWWRLRDPDMAAASAMAAPDIIDYMREF